MKLPKFLFNIKVNQRRLLIAAVFGIFIALLAAAPLVIAKATQNKTIYRLQIAGLPLGGKTREQAQVILEQPTALFQDGVEFQYEGAKQKIKNSFFLDKDATLNNAFSLGHNQGIIKNSLARIKILATGEEISPVWRVDDQALIKEINDIFSLLLKIPANAAFAISFDNQGSPQIEITPEQNGLIFDQTAIISDLEERLNNFSPEPIILKTTYKEPIIKSSELEPLRISVEKILKRKELKIALEEKEWIVKQDKLASWIDAKKENQEVKITLNKKAAESFLKKIAAEVDRAPIKPVFEMNAEQTKVINFIPAAPGEKILMEENFKALEQEFLNTLAKTEKEYQTVNLLTIKSWPETQTGETNQFSIREIVGIGRTNFKGSPPNRVKNIKRGAEILNGLLIAPNEEFSLLANLRPFTEENGYFKELVIKAAEGRTVPEIGGGLCQIGTTAFRVALNAGLPITVRQNHFYRVSYYEPPVGMDATIYDPAPDFKFINDTNNYLLFRTRVEKNDLIFELWGTLDGRQIEISQPIVSNITKPPEKKIIETLDLKPSETKCTEKAHNGADASFTYKVSYSDGQIKEKEFKSKYRPWQEVCLLGVKELTPPPPVENPPPTDATTPIQPPTPEITPVAPD